VVKNVCEMQDGLDKTKTADEADEGVEKLEAAA